MPSPALPNFGPFPAAPSPAPLAPQGGGEDLWLDTEQARGAVEEMRTIVEDLANINMDLDPQFVIPLAKDLVSKNFVINCMMAADDAKRFFSAWQNELGMAIDSLDKQVEAHELAEEQNRRNFTRS